MQFGSVAMTDDTFVAALQNCSYPIENFHHADHLRLGWILLSKMDPVSASAEAAKLIRNFGLHHGKGHIYHETVTRAWMRLLACHHEPSFEEFLSRNAGRISTRLLYEFWREETLNSQQARAEWVEPDLRSLPSSQRGGGSVIRNPLD